MIEALIMVAAIALVLVIGAIALVLLSEIRKQKRPSKFRFQQRSQLTPEQEQAIRPIAYLGGSIGMIASAFARTTGLSMGEFFLYALALALFVGLLAWLVLRNSSTRSTASSSDQPQSPSRPTELQRQLIRMCGGDRQTAERLAALEGGDWQAAIDRLIRDRR